jgi:hypothetical protein
MQETVNVTTLEEHADGSATVHFDFNAEQVEALMRAGMMQAIERGLDEGRQYDPDNPCGPAYVKLTDEQLCQYAQYFLNRVYKSATTEIQLAVYLVMQYISSPEEFEQWLAQREDG